MTDPTQKSSRVWGTAKDTQASPDNSVMLGCYDVWSATPENTALCDGLYRARESAEKTL